MPIGTPSVIFGGSNIAAGTNNVTTADAPAGSLIVVGLGTWASTNGTTTGVSDSAGNTYTKLSEGAPTVGIPYPAAIWYSSNITHLPLGGTISQTNSGNVTYSIVACVVSGANGGSDVHTTANASGVTTNTLASGGLAASSEIIFGLTATTGSLSGYAANSPFTEIGFSPSGNAMGFAYDIVSTNASVNFAPSWSSNQTIAQCVGSFKAPASASALKFNPNLDGLSSSGGFFCDPLARVMLGWRKRATLWLPERFA